MTKFNYMFAMFDGEGGSDGSASSFGLGDDARAFLRSLGETDEGIAELDGQFANESSEAEPDIQNEQNGTAPEDVDGPAPSEETFQDLIAKGGRYHEEYGRMVSQAIKDRFKNQADYKSTVEGYDDALNPLYAKYGLEPGDIEGLKSSIAEDDSNFADAAQREGLTIDQYKKNLALQQEAERGRQITEAYELEKARSAMYAQWDADANALKESFPNFDLGMEIEQNEEFAHLLDNGVSVQNAFFATHAVDILNGMNAESNAQAKQTVVSNIKQRASRPPENAAKHNPAANRRFDPNQLSDEDFDKMLKRVREGEVISF